MGMFDTLKFDTSITCKHCGADVQEVQTHTLGNLLKVYQVGDIADEPEVKTGLLEETIFCSKCNSNAQKVYIVIWHSLVAGVYADEAKAESMLLGVDRAAILNHLMRQQIQREELLRRYIELYHTIEGYRAFLMSQASGKDWANDARYLATRLTEFVKDADPLARILDAYSPEKVEDYVSEA